MVQRDDIQLKFVREFAKFVDLDDTLAMVEDDENGNRQATFASKMNEEDEGLSNDDISQHNGFDPRLFKKQWSLGIEKGSTWPGNRRGRPSN